MATSDLFDFPMTIAEAQALLLTLQNQLYFTQWDFNYPPSMGLKTSLETLETKLIGFINTTRVQTFPT